MPHDAHLAQPPCSTWADHAAATTAAARRAAAAAVVGRRHAHGGDAWRAERTLVGAAAAASSARRGLAGCGHAGAEVFRQVDALTAASWLDGSRFWSSVRAATAAAAAAGRARRGGAKRDRRGREAPAAAQLDETEGEAEGEAEGAAEAVAEMEAAPPSTAPLGPCGSTGRRHGAAAPRGLQALGSCGRRASALEAAMQRFEPGVAGATDVQRRPRRPRRPPASSAARRATGRACPRRGDDLVDDWAAYMAASAGGTKAAAYFVPPPARGRGGARGRAIRPEGARRAHRQGARLTEQWLAAAEGQASARRASPRRARRGNGTVVTAHAPTHPRAPSARCTLVAALDADVVRLVVVGGQQVVTGSWPGGTPRRVPCASHAAAA